ncbi:MAG: hypothetical protein UU47_C0007G0015 [candidate division TM6 bacterium GW2011_GWE2_41_16]|nr:MAG: hypothetical protein UU47_C0007G0015 [candidate division TM6 bacterium GW2011_GWE2_41_16]
MKFLKNVFLASLLLAPVCACAMEVKPAEEQPVTVQPPVVVTAKTKGSGSTSSTKIDTLRDYFCIELADDVRSLKNVIAKNPHYLPATLVTLGVVAYAIKYPVIRYGGAIALGSYLWFTASENGKSAVRNWGASIKKTVSESWAKRDSIASGLAKSAGAFFVATFAKSNVPAEEAKPEPAK